MTYPHPEITQSDWIAQPVATVVTWHAIWHADGKKDRYAVESKCGAYKVCKLGGEREPARFEAWHRKKIIACNTFPQRAKDACQAHAVALAQQRIAANDNHHLRKQAA